MVGDGGDCRFWGFGSVGVLECNLRVGELGVREVCCWPEYLDRATAVLGTDTLSHLSGGPSAH